jgi:GntR family transcriptional regulator
MTRDDGRPLYDKVYRALRDDIEGGVLRPGELMPSERAVGSRLKVSRITVRRAMQQLAVDGLIETTSGRGSRVASLGEPPNSLLSFTAMAAERGLVTSASVLSCQVREASIDEAEILRIPPGAPIFELHRLRLLGGLPIAVDSSHISYDRVRGIERVDFATASLYHTLESDFGISATRADYALEAVGATARESQLLDVELGAPLLSAAETMYDQFDRPTDIGRIVYRGDRYRFRARLLRRVP